MSAKTRVAACVSGYILHFRINALTPMGMVSSLLSPAAYGILLVIKGTLLSPTSLTVAILLIAVWGALLVNCVMAIVQERNWGTLPLIVLSPAGVTAPLLGRLMATASQGLLSGFLILPPLILALRPATLNLNFVTVACAMVLIPIAYLGMSLMIVALIVTFRYASGSVNGLMGLVLLASGAFVSLAKLPLALKLFASTLPTARLLYSPTENDYLLAFVGTTMWFILGLVVLEKATVGVRRNPSAFMR